MSKKGKAKPKEKLDHLLREVRDAEARWRQNGELAVKEGHYIEASLALERAIMLRWVLEEAELDG